MSNSHKEDLDIQETEFGGSTVSKQRKVIHFSSGETLEEEENSEAEGDDSTEAFKEPAEKARFSWRNVTILVGRMSLHTCDFLGGKLAGLLGLNAAKYQYAIDQYDRDHKTVKALERGSWKAGERDSNFLPDWTGNMELHVPWEASLIHKPALTYVKDPTTEDISKTNT